MSVLLGCALRRWIFGSRRFERTYFSCPQTPKNPRTDTTGWGISRLTPLYATNGLLAAFKMAAVAPMSRISYSFTRNHYILRARCVRHAVRGMKGC